MKHSWLLSLLWMGLAFGQGLPTLTPPNPAVALVVQPLGQKEAIQTVAADLQQSGLAELWQELLGEAEIADNNTQALVGLLQGGLSVAMYPTGDFFAIFQPSAQALQQIKQSTAQAKIRGGWAIDTTDGLGFVAAYSRDRVILASPAAFERFMRGERGLRLPTQADVVFWATRPQGFSRAVREVFELPRELNPLLRAINSFKRIVYSFNFVPYGTTAELRVELDPTQDADLVRLLTPNQVPWPLGEFPIGVGMISGVLDMPGWGRYLSRISRDLGSPLGLNLNAFGQRFAVVTLSTGLEELFQDGANTPEDTFMQLLEGWEPSQAFLVWLEVQDPKTAEAVFLSWLQNLIALLNETEEEGFRLEDANAEGFRRVLAPGVELHYKVQEDRLLVAVGAGALEGLKRPALQETPESLSLPLLPQRTVAYSFSDNRPYARLVSNALQYATNQLDGIDQEAGAAIMGFLQRLLARFGLQHEVYRIEGHSIVVRSVVQINWENP